MRHALLFVAAVAIGCGSSSGTPQIDADTELVVDGAGGAGGPGPTTMDARGTPHAADAAPADLKISGPDALPDLTPPKLDAAATESDAATRDGAAADRLVIEVGSADGPSASRQTARPLGSTAAARGYYEYLPPGYGDGTKHPLLVFWHGVGENGNGTTDLKKVIAHGPPKIIAQNKWPAERPFIVLSPQHPGGDCPSATEIRDFFTYALANYQVDERRVYLTGLSCGAIGTWAYLGQFRGSLVAAAVPIAGDGRNAFKAAGCALGELGIWAFHGDADQSVPVMGTTATMTSLIACPMPPRKEMKMTIYPGVPHDSWTRTYDLSAGHDIYTWLLGFSR